MNRILLCGNNKSLIDTFFTSKIDGLEFISTTENTMDIINHLNSIPSPNAFCFCAKGEDAAQYQKLKESFPSISEKQILTISICNESDSTNFKAALTPNEIQLNLSSALPFGKIIEEIKTFVAPVTDGRVFQAPKTETETFVSRTNKRKILVIDDDPIMLKTIKQYLEKGYTVAAANNAKIALKFLESHSVDLILLDYKMPEMDGVQFLTEFRKNLDLNSAVPVVFLTGVADKALIQEAMKLKVNGYLLKPLDSIKLFEKIHSIFN